METAKNAPPAQLMEEYRRQMMAMYQQSAVRSAPSEDWLDNRFPEPDIQRDRAAMAEPGTTPIIDTPADTPPPPPIAETPFVGYLRVFTFTADQAEPIPGARVIVSRGDTIFANTETDRDGYTPVIPLPSVDPELSLRPGNVQPYVAYTIEAYADGFRAVRHENVPVYGNNYVTQPIALLPLLPDEAQPPMRNFVSGGPTNL